MAPSIRAKVLLAGLQRAGAKRREALEGQKKLELGGLELGYGPNDDTGLEFVDLSLIDGSGRFRRRPLRRP